MGNYIIQADLKDKLPDSQLLQLTDDTKSGTINAQVVSDAIADSEALVDGYVAVQYATPLSPVPRLVKALTIDVTVFRLYARRQRIPDDVKLANDLALRKLEQIAKGILSLGPTAPEPVTASAGEVFGPAREFTRDKMSGF